MKSKAVFVDWDGTLSQSKFWAPNNESQLDPDVVEQFTTFLFRTCRDLVKEWMRGNVSSANIAELIGTQYGLSPSAVYSDLKSSCEQMTFIDSKVTDSVSSIRERGAKVVIATDNMDTFETWTVPALKLEDKFDGILASPTLGALKADIRNGQSLFFYNYLLQQGLKPEETVLLDDNVENAVVKSIGMGFIHVNQHNTLDTILDSLT
jgi:FMN phosphatase YigB (HAD superfamily)